jgi:hypothetical protein
MRRFAVGAAKKSIVAISLAWLFKKPRHLREVVLRCLLTGEQLDAGVTRTSCGTYRLGYVDRGTLIEFHAGRSDSELNDRLLSLCQGGVRERSPQISRFRWKHRPRRRAARHRISSAPFRMGPRWGSGASFLGEVDRIATRRLRQEGPSSSCPSAGEDALGAAVGWSEIHAGSPLLQIGSTRSCSALDRNCRIVGG